MQNRLARQRLLCLTEAGWRSLDQGPQPNVWQPELGRCPATATTTGTSNSPTREQLREEFNRDDDRNVVDVAHVLGVATSTVLRYLRQGEIFAIKRGRESYITEEDVREYITRVRA